MPSEDDELETRRVYFSAATKEHMISQLAGLPPLLDGGDASRPAITNLDVRAGDLWSLSWDGAYRGLALIAAVKEGFVLAWPVTLPDAPAFAPALVLEPNPLVHPLFVWPTRETGVGLHLLDQSLGALLRPTRISQIAAAMDAGT